MKPLRQRERAPRRNGRSSFRSFKLLKIKLDRRDRPAGELGEAGETDALTVLSNAFPGDELGRVPRGRNGGDIEHRIMQGGEVVAKLLWEAKNVRVYQRAWAVKARADQIAGQFDHVVIVTSAFPSRNSELMVETNGVLICSPDRLVAVATWLRLFCIRSHSLRLSGQNRLEKSDRLYRFMVSDAVQDRWSRMTQTMTRMREALRAERISHDTLWGDRTDQLDVLELIRDTFIEDLHCIFEGAEPEPSS